MNSRQRVLRAIAMSGPDRVPIMHGTLPDAIARHGDALRDLHRRHPEDVLNVGAATYGEFGPEIGAPSRDPWGCLWVRHSDEQKGQVTYNPLADWSDLDDYRPPDTASDQIVDRMRRRLTENAAQKYTLADAYATMFDVVRRSGKHVWIHCYGVNEEIIPDLIEIGVHVLNPQSSCVNRERLRRLVAGRICVLGDIDRQPTLPRGTPDDVRAAVRADIDDFGCFTGGLVSYGKVGGDVLLENIEAMLDEMVRYGAAAHRRFQ